MKNIYLIVGPSGVGKTTLVEQLCKKRGYVPVDSYTTRPPRTADEKGHIFVSDGEFDRLYPDMVAYTDYNGYRYGVTAEEVDNCDLYVIDPDGVEYFFEKYKGSKGAAVIWLEASEPERAARMRERGDSPDAIERRLQNDRKVFYKTRYPFSRDLIIHSDGISQTANAVDEYILFREKYDQVVTIYQIQPEKDKKRLIFAGSDYLSENSSKDGVIQIEFDSYEPVYQGPVPFENLEDLYTLFNSDNRPRAEKLRSLSVSDIVEIRNHKNPELNGYWFCDSFGWKRMADCHLLE